MSLISKIISSRKIEWLVLFFGVLATVILRLFINYLPPNAFEPPLLEIWLHTWIFSCLSLFVIIAVQQKNHKKYGHFLVGLLGVCLAGIVLFGLGDTSYSLNGIGGDQGFVTAQITRYAWSGTLSDFAYNGLPAFNPPLYWYVLGRTARLFDLQPYRMVKHGLLVTALFLPYFSYFFWTKIQKNVPAFLPALVVLIYQNWYRPDEWLSLILFIPWWIYFIEGVGVQEKQKGWLWKITGGIIGAALFTTYFYWFFVGGTSLLISFALQHKAKLNVAVAPVKQKIITLCIAALFSAPYWGPYMFKVLSTSNSVFFQNRYFIASFTNLELPFLEFSIRGLILLFGLYYAVRNFRRNLLAFSLFNLLLAAYAWELLGYPALLLNHPLLSFKTRDFVIVVLASSALIGFAKLLRKNAITHSQKHAHGDLIATLSLILLVSMGQRMVEKFAADPLLGEARRTSYPEDLIAQYQHATNDDYINHVVLAEQPGNQLTMYLPVYQYLSWAAHYSHPAGQYNDRVQFLQNLAEVDNPTWFAAALMNNRYSHIDELLLLPVEEGYRFSYRADYFPYPTVSEPIIFAEELFDSTLFLRKEVDRLVMFVPLYNRDPLKNLDYNIENITPKTDFGTIGDADDMLIFLELFGSDIELADQADLASALHSMLQDSQ